MERPFVFGVDLDGVCADHTAAFREIVAKERRVPTTSLPFERSWGFAEWGLDDAEFERLHEKAVVDHRMLRDLPVIEGASEVLWRLSDAGIWIRVITHRLYTNWGHAVAAADTVAWLDDVSIPYRDICFVGHKVSVDADVYVEDGPHNINDLRGEGRTVIVFDQPYNRELGGPRARSWGQVEQIVNELASDHPGGLQGQLPGFDVGADRLERNKGRFRI